MKKSFIALLVAIAPVLTFAQDFHRHEIGLSLTFGNQGDPYYDKFRDGVFNLSDFENTITEGFPCYYTGFNLDYFYSIDSKLSIGANLGYARAHEEYMEINPVGDKTDYYCVCSDLYHLMPSVRYVWLKWKNVRLYSMASLGAAYLKNSMDYDKHTYNADQELVHHDVVKDYRKEDKVVFAYQLTPFGFENGRKHHHFFFEIGWGYKGCFTTGYRYSF